MNTQFSDIVTKTQHFIEQVRAYNEHVFEQSGKYPSFYTHHYGCQQNVSDGEKINGMLLDMGYVQSLSPQDADLVLYNTCAVRENAEDRIFGNVGALKHAKRRNPKMTICLCGCMVQQEHIGEKIRKSYPYVDILFGTHAMHLFPELLYQRLTGGKRAFATPEKGDIVEGLPVERDGSIKAWLPIMYGCNNFCTYCVVPLVRGREKSREPQAILQEARELVAQGYKEITLLGQNVNSYGKTLAEPMNFSELLRELQAIEGEFRIRFMTSHPKDCTKELIDTIADCPKVCRHIHLPVQSGSNRILKSMNRGYTSEQYLSLIDYAREKMPGISFTSDIIVGFPGETYEDFLQTLKLVKRVQYQSLFTFVYSKREGTKAASMPDPIPREEKMKWFTELLDVQKSIGSEQNVALVGQTVRVLVEGPGKTGEEYLTGRTEQNIIVDFIGPLGSIGKFVDVKITQALNWAVLGEIA